MIFSKSELVFWILLFVFMCIASWDLGYVHGRTVTMEMFAKYWCLR